MPLLHSTFNYTPGNPIKAVSDDRSVDQPLYGLINDFQRYQKPLARFAWPSKAVLDFNVYTRIAKEPMKQVFHLGRADVINRIRFDWLDRCEQKRVVFSRCKPRFDASCREANLIQLTFQLPNFRGKRKALNNINLACERALRLFACLGEGVRRCCIYVAVQGRPAVLSMIAGLKRRSFMSVRRKRANISPSGKSTRRSSMIFLARRKTVRSMIGSMQFSLLIQTSGWLYTFLSLSLHDRRLKTRLPM